MLEAVSFIAFVLLLGCAGSIAYRADYVPDKPIVDRDRIIGRVLIYTTQSDEPSHNRWNRTQHHQSQIRETLTAPVAIMMHRKDRENTRCSVYGIGSGACGTGSFRCTPTVSYVARVYRSVAAVASARVARLGNLRDIVMVGERRSPVHNEEASEGQSRHPRRAPTTCNDAMLNHFWVGRFPIFRLRLAVLTDDHATPGATYSISRRARENESFSHFSNQQVSTGGNRRCSRLLTNFAPSAGHPKRIEVSHFSASLFVQKSMNLHRRRRSAKFALIQRCAGISRYL
jgi:hypothetical protein